MKSTKHLEFIRLVANGSEQDKAYKLTVGNNKVTSATARVKGSILAKKYAEEILEAKQNAQKVVDEANQTKDVQVALKQILIQAEVDAINCRIISGDLFDVSQLNAFGKVVKAKITPTISERLAAIEKYNKRFGSNESIKTDLNVTGMVAPNIILSKK